MKTWIELNEELKELNKMNEVEFARVNGKEKREELMRKIRELENEMVKDLEW